MTTTAHTSEDVSTAGFAKRSVSNDANVRKPKSHSYIRVQEASIQLVIVVHYVCRKGGKQLCLNACTMRDITLVEFMSGVEVVEVVVRMAHGLNMVVENTILVGEVVGIGTEALSAVEVVVEGV